MHINDFAYQLPAELIARYPAEQRTGSRLLCLDGNSGVRVDRQFSDLINLLNPNDLLVLNNTRVIKARLFGRKESGGKVEVFVERVLAPQQALARIGSSKKVAKGTLLHLGDIQVKVLGNAGIFYHLAFLNASVLEVLEREGHVPLPPYMERTDETLDCERYQTVYNKVSGAVAAPTAGLHFDKALLDVIKQKGVSLAEVTLHVGSGTFQPVHVEDIEAHQMHSEYMEVSESVCQKVADTRKRGGRVIAVGTTSMRCLETAAKSGTLSPYSGETDLFIKPGFPFQVVDALVTNFHIPKSTLLILVCAFSGKDNILSAYEEAIAKRYQFYSYGDAMFLTRKTI